MAEKGNLLMSGMASLGLALSGTLISGTPWYVAPLGIGGAVLAFGFDFYMGRRSELENVFLNCGLCIKDKEQVLLPKKIKKVDTDNGYNVVLTLPKGLCLDDFVKKEQHISQALDANVSFRYNNGNIIMYVSTSKLPKLCKFESIQYLEPLKIAIGRDAKGVFAVDMEQAIHLLIAGSTGAGKSVLLRSLITGLILTKASDDVELHLVDFMRVELGIFKKSSMVKSFTTEPEEFEILLQELKEESKRRLQLFDNANLVNISSYNRRYPKQKLPYILIVIDEFASLAEHKDIMKLLKVRLAQDRKCGIHYIICTQRPSVDIISGTIKVNIPTRIALKMCTDTDSQVVLDQNGAEKLSCVGRALVKQSEVEEIQVAYLGEQEARRLVKHTFIRKAQAKVIQKPKGWIEIG